MVKSVQNMVGKSTHPLSTEKCSSGTNMELHSTDAYEPQWPMAPKEVTSCGYTVGCLSVVPTPHHFKYGNNSLFKVTLTLIIVDYMMCIGR